MALSGDQGTTALALRDAAKAAKVDATIALLDEALRLVATADANLTRDLRDAADLAALFARREKSERLMRAAAELRLRTDARFGDLAGPALSAADAAAKARAQTPQDPVSPRGTQDQDPLAGLERQEIHKLRKVASVQQHIGAYLQYTKDANEDPTRNGLLKWVESQERALRDALRREEDLRQPVGRIVLAGTEDAAENASAKGSAARNDAAGIAGRVLSNTPPPTKKGAPAAPAFSGLPIVAHEWRAFSRDVVPLRDRLRDRLYPTRIAPPGEKDVRQEFHRALLDRLDTLLSEIDEAIETEPALLQSAARARAKAGA